MDIVRTYNLSGKFISEQHFPNAEKAHNEYKHIIEKRWSFTVEEREYGPYIVSKLEKLLVI